MSISALRTLISGAAELVWPRRCWLCEDRSHNPLCDPCRLELVADSGPTCPWCCATVGPHTDCSDGCAQCRGSRFHFDAAIRLGKYDGRLRESVLRLKQETGEGFAEELGELLAINRADLMKIYQSEVIVPVPLHWRRRWYRGYNQSAAVARGLAHRLGLSSQSGWLVRTRPTPTQQGQSATARRENMRNAFRVRRGVRVQGMRVLLVDDVMTTGATADAASAALRQAGAAQVVVAVLARR